jgi:hypothetical protein
MKTALILRTAIISLVLSSLFPSASLAQIGIADPVTGNATISFWGKVVDQDNNPLPGAKVSLALDYGLAISPTEGGLRRTNLALQTDQNGSFAVSNLQGHGFDIKSIEKDGYKLSERVSRSYSYSWSANIFHPDQQNPVIFRMWKKLGSEALISGDDFYGVNPDGRAYTIDLLTRKKFEGVGMTGDIIVRIKRPPELKPRTKFDWSYSVEAVDGGILQTNDEFTYRAPESGYRDRYEYVASASSTNWTPELRDQEFYVKSRNGQVFGTLVVKVIPEYNQQSVFAIQYSVNPSGSRNLER